MAKMQTKGGVAKKGVRPFGAKKLAPAVERTYSEKRAAARKHEAKKQH